jgi:mRNA-degrading endonuclease RelE of RelBE toxin-antitoxin system
MTWIVHIHDGAAKQLKAIPPDRRQRVLDDIAAFEEDPFRGLVKPIKGKDHKGHYRKVSGRYRIIFKTRSSDKDRRSARRSSPQRK